MSVLANHGKDCGHHKSQSPDLVLWPRSVEQVQERHRLKWSIHKAWQIADRAIGDLFFAITRWSPIFTWKKDRKVIAIAIAKFDDPDVEIARSLIKTRLRVNSFQDSEFVMFFMSWELKKILIIIAWLERVDYLSQKSPKRSRGRWAAIAIGSQKLFKLRLGSRSRS